MKNIYIVFTFSLLTLFQTANSQNVFNENFDDVNSLYSAGWTQQNNSSPLGAEIWHNGMNLLIPAFNGPDSSYAEVSFRSTTTTGVGTISNWLITPTINLSYGDVVTFYTSSFDNVSSPDGMELRLNTLNTTNVGSTSTSIGDFSTLLLELNPNHYHDTAYYPQNYWGQFAVTINGLSVPTDCRIAFRYSVIFGGGGGLNSSAIGVDGFSVDFPVGINETTNDFNIITYPNPVSDRLTIDFGKPLSESSMVYITDIFGKSVVSFMAVKGQVKAIFDSSTMASGIYCLRIDSQETQKVNFFVKN